VIKAVLLHGMVSLRASHGTVPPKMDTLRQLAAAASTTLLGDSPPMEPSPRDVQSLQGTQLLLKATTDAAAHVVKVRPPASLLALCTSTRSEWQRADSACHGAAAADNFRTTACERAWGTLGTRLTLDVGGGFGLALAEATVDVAKRRHHEERGQCDISQR
jgi:hypothetical protein